MKAEEMTLEALRGKDSRELLLDVQELRKELFELRFRGASEEIADSSRFTTLRRTIARIHTLLRQREIEQQKGVAAQGQS